MINFSEEYKNLIKKIEEINTEEYWKELYKTLDEFVDRLEPEGWTLPSIMTFSEVRDIVKTEEIKDINILMKSYFSQDEYYFMKDTVQGILYSKIKKGLKKVATECWKAFQGGLYALCSIGLLTVIEGIFSEFSDNKKELRMMKICQEKVNSFPVGDTPIAKYAWISCNRFIRNLYQRINFNDDEPKTINRHWLLHGRSDYEIEEIDCIRLFNAVASLCMVFKHKDDLIPEEK